MDKKQVSQQVETQCLPVYQPPEVVTYADQEILEEMGPAQALTGDLDL